MKKLILISFVFVVLSCIIFTSCNEDTTPPKLYWYNSAGDIVKTGDTTVLLYTKYVDPGVYAEDNVSKEADITIVNDAATVLSVTTDGYLRRTGDYVITYTAEDAEGNKAEYFRNIYIRNITEPFIKSYATTRNTLHLAETTYNSSVSADNRIPGRLRFPKVYAHTWDGSKTYFRVNADLFNPQNLSSSFSETISFMGTKSDKETPFFKDLTYEQGVDTALSFVMLKIDAQEYEDTAGVVSVYIQGVTDQVTDYPKSRIEYLSNSKTITRIVLELNVTKAGVVDKVTEVYIPND
ncbi:MAG: hypothetical protein PHZ24_08735 [Bacteroidales bacterium]|nr:hypothetical protein [Bacteroidales bacterium]